MNEPIPTQPLVMPKEEVRFWKNELLSSEDFQKKEFLERYDYKKIMRFIEGEQHPESTNPSSITQMDEIYPGSAAIISNTYYQDPEVNTKASHPDSDKPIEIPLEAQVAMMAQTGAPPDISNITYSDLMRDALKYAIKKHGLKGEAQLAIFDLLTAGFCVIEANHLTQSEASVAPTDGTAPMMDQIGEALGSAVQFVKDKLSAAETEEKVASEVDSKGKDYIFDSTYIERWSPLDILFDYRAKVFKKSRYIAKRVELTIADFNTAFPAHKGKIAPHSDNTQSVEMTHQSSNENKKCVKVYEMQIKKKTGVCILKVTEGIDDSLDYYELPFTTNGFTLKYGCLDKFGKLYPPSRIYRAMKPQSELNHQLTIQTEHADRSLKKIAVDMTGLTQSGKNAIKDPDVYAIVEKNRPSPVFEVLPVGGTSPENEAVQVKMLESVNKQLGVNELAKSGQSDSEFATQDQLKQQSFQENSSAIRDALADVLKEVIDTLKDIIMQMWDGDDFFQVTGKQGAQFWYRPEMGKLSDLLIGDYDIDIDITSAQKPNPMQNRTEASELWMLLSNPTTQQFLMSKGKTLSLSALENVLKRYKVNPDTMFEELTVPPMPMAIPPQTMNPTGPSGGPNGPEANFAV